MAKPSHTSIIAKERDICYQYSRHCKFRKLLNDFPNSYNEIKVAAVLDVPPLLRGKIWAAVLNVRGDSKLIYDSFDKDTEYETDRQLDLDIPRCHQYHPSLASPQGHAKMKRVLKAWISAERDKHVYWQGLDSVCATFLSLSFNNEVCAYNSQAVAFCSMRQFILNFCTGFFVKDNSKLMREYY
jgi:TBC domain-containing protein kinase-like protein